MKVVKLSYEDEASIQSIFEWLSNILTASGLPSDRVQDASSSFKLDTHEAGGSIYKGT